MCIWYDDTSLLGINDVYRERHMRVERKSDWDSAVEDNTASCISSRDVRECT